MINPPDEQAHGDLRANADKVQKSPPKVGGIAFMEWREGSWISSRPNRYRSCVSRGRSGKSSPSANRNYRRLRNEIILKLSSMYVVSVLDYFASLI
jgi:hypothetical protein